MIKVKQNHVRFIVNKQFILSIVSLMFISTTIFAQIDTAFYADFEGNNLVAKFKKARLARENGGGLYAAVNPDKDAVNNSEYVMLASTRESLGDEHGRAEYYTDWGTPFATENRTHIYQWYVYFPEDYLDNVEIEGDWNLITQFVTDPCARGRTGFEDAICYGGGIFNEVRISRSDYGEYGFQYRAKPSCNIIEYRYPKGEWIKFTQEIYWTEEFTGWYKVWANETLVDEAEGMRTLPEGYTNDGACGIRWKIGLYDKWTSDVVDSVYYYIDKLELYIDEDIMDICPDCVSSIPDTCNNLFVSEVVTHENEGMSNGAIEIETTGGNAPFSYEWSNNSITEDISSLNAGDYSLTVIDDIGCEITEDYTVDLIVDPGDNMKPIITIDSSMQVYGGSVNTLNVTEATDPEGDPLVFHWITPDGVSTSEVDSSILSFLAPDVINSTTETFFLEVSDGVNTVFKSIEVNIEPYKPQAKQINISSSQASSYEHPNYSENISDGNLETRWSVQGVGEWVVLELEEPDDISHFKMLFHKREDRKAIFDILVSNDGVTWELIGEGLESCGFSNDAHVVNTPEAMVNNEYGFVKVVANGNSVNDWNSIVEVEVYSIPENREPVILIDTSLIVYGGTKNVINAADAFDPEGESLVYRWIIPDSISSYGMDSIEVAFLAPDVMASTTESFTLEVSDGVHTELKSIDVSIEPYKPQFEHVKVVSIEVSNYQSPNYPENILDGNSETRWSVQGIGEWVILGLEKPVDISHFKVSFHGREDRKAFFDIFASEDGVDWELFDEVESCGFSDNPHVFDAPETKASGKYEYVKLVVNGNTENDWNSITEVEVYGSLESASSRGEISPEDIVEVFPNPATSYLNISLEGGGDMKIYDLEGKLLYSDILMENLNQVAINFPPGIYIVQVQTAENITLQKRLIVK